MIARWPYGALPSCAAIAFAVGCSSGELGAPEGRLEEVDQAVTQIACASDADCATGNPCLIAVCDPNTDVCHTTTTNVACDDGNACTTNDACAAGTCVGGGPAPGCSPCQAAAVLPPEGGTFTGTVSGTSTLQGSCATSGGSPERVYSWTPARSGRATFSTCGGTTSFDTVLYLLSGTCASSAEVACNDDTTGCATSDGANHGSRVSFNVVANQTYYVVVDGWGGRQGNYTLDVTPPSVCGDGVREGAEQCDGADAAACSGNLCNADCTCKVPSTGLPDLVPTIADASVQYDATVAAGDVVEGCARATTGNALLVFSAITSNRGTADMVLGDPGCPDCATNPLAVCANPAYICSPAGGHNHGHYENYALYELLDASGTTVAAGHKQGFCLRDDTCTKAKAKFDCTNQGITAGCSDVYGAGLGCQYIDIGGVAPGQYMVRVRVDPFNEFVELDETNNDVTVPVTIPPKPTPEVIPAGGGTFQGTTSGLSAEAGSCASRATASAPEHVYQWTPSASGVATIKTCGTLTTFDTVLYMRAASSGVEIACNDDTAGCGVADGSSGASRQGSVITPTVTAGQTYTIVVDGYGGSNGGSQGSYVLTVIPPSGGSGQPDVIPPAGGTFTGTTSGSSAATGTCASATGGAPEHVYQWTPSTSGVATLETCGALTTFDTVLYMRAASSGAEIACNDDTAGCSTGDSSSAAFRHGSVITPTVTAGQTYTIVVDGYAGSNAPSQGSYILTVVPPSSASTQPEVIPAAGGTFTGTTSGSSTMTGTCAQASGGAPEHVFQWTPSKSGVAKLQTCGTLTTFDTVLYMRTALSGGSELACNDDTNGCSVADGSSAYFSKQGSVIQPTVTAGVTYYVIVDGYQGSPGGSAGSFALTVTPPP